jgi:hypothetical protein
LAVNDGKRQAIVFSKGPKEPGEILVGVTEAPWREALDYLGISLDKRLSMKRHARKIQVI